MTAELGCGAARISAAPAVEFAKDEHESGSNRSVSSGTPVALGKNDEFRSRIDMGQE